MENYNDLSVTFMSFPDNSMETDKDNGIPYHPSPGAAASLSLSGPPCISSSSQVSALGCSGSPFLSQPQQPRSRQNIRFP